MESTKPAIIPVRKSAGRSQENETIQLVATSPDWAKNSVGSFNGRA
jgi:hypothetical protein